MIDDCRKTSRNAVIFYIYKSNEDISLYVRAGTHINEGFVAGTIYFFVEFVDTISSYAAFI